MASIAPVRRTALTFWQKMNIGMALFILFGFAQFAARGFVDYDHAPLIFHLHGMLMVGWLGLVVSQSLLAGRGALALHMAMGWASVIMVPAIVIVASLTSLSALASGLTPPFFTPAYFLALVHVSAIAFAVMVMAAVVLREQTAWHKRLMVGSSVLLLEPALGRVLPMPLIMPWGEWLSLAIQLGVVWLIVREDRRSLGAVHPATLAVAMGVASCHIVYESLARIPAWQALATAIAAG
ncbi:hypothetical protein B2G71_10835 [Novosphingobium sp. PC22D]|uniref:hypothetical protein n=1 Tax=Novosphingobium sp. PC22D TaxID=1962403 RepID=UPI000BF02282|nr:hypothetical protein [Novosphingobium sp. PC22D]PEQ12782.1 hypothetical protein B2G71_10835 [Novosphingobium sp. PC22D]